MKLFLKGHNFAYAAQQIYMCMFPDTHAEITEDEPFEGDYIISGLESGTDAALAKTEIHLGGKVNKSEYTAFFASEDEEDIKRACRKAIKTSFYNAALPFLPKKPAWGSLTGIRPSKVAGAFLAQGLSREETVRAMQEEYYVSEARAALATACAVRAEKLLSEAETKDMSLYVGIPFCASRCRYCSFVSHSVEKAKHLVTPYIETLGKELSMLGKTVADAGLKLRSVYIGGGTPTALSAEELFLVMQYIAKNFDLDNCIEYTVEGGRPDTLTVDKLKVIKNGGATRISVNPQTMNDTILKAMDRRHTAEDVVKAIESVRQIGGMSINADLIAGLPGDNFDSFRNSVDRICSLAPENITVHTLAIKKGSELHKEKYVLPDGEETAAMVEYAMKKLYATGYEPYYLYRQKYMSGNLENVGYSKPGFENLYNNYIMDELHTIISAGAGGVTKLINKEKSEIERIFNPKYPYEYNEAEDKFRETAQKIKNFFK